MPTVTDISSLPKEGARAASVKLVKNIAKRIIVGVVVTVAVTVIANAITAKLENEEA